MRTVVGVFDTLVQTRKVIEALSAAGFEAENVSVISTGSTLQGIDRREGAEGPDDTVDKNRFNPGLAPDSDTGLDVAAPLLSTAQVSSFDMAFPSKEQMYPVAKGETGVGAVGLHKALQGWGLSGDEIRDYEKAVAQGRSLLGVEVVDNDTVPRATEIFQQYGATSVIAANPFAHK